MCDRLARPTGAAENGGARPGRRGGCSEWVRYEQTVRPDPIVRLRKCGMAMEKGRRMTSDSRPRHSQW